MGTVPGGEHIWANVITHLFEEMCHRLALPFTFIHPRFFLRTSVSSSDADWPAALRSRDREAPELHPQHGRPLHRMDLRRWSDHGGKLPGNRNLIRVIDQVISLKPSGLLVMLV